MPYWQKQRIIHIHVGIYWAKIALLCRGKWGWQITFAVTELVKKPFWSFISSFRSCRVNESATKFLCLAWHLFTSLLPFSNASSGKSAKSGILSHHVFLPLRYSLCSSLTSSSFIFGASCLFSFSSGSDTGSRPCSASKLFYLSCLQNQYLQKQNWLPLLGSHPRKLHQTSPTVQCLKKKPSEREEEKLRQGYPERCHNHCFNFNCFRLFL